MTPKLASWSRRFLPVAIGMCLVLALSACAGHWIVYGTDQLPQTALLPGSEVAEYQQQLLVWIFWLAVVVFVFVEGALVYAMLRYRRRPGDPLPRQVHGNTRLEIAWTIAPALILVGIAVPTAQTIFSTQDVEPHPNDLKVNVVAHQWWWEFQYPDLKVVTANELHIPVGQRVFLTLDSADVIHSFWIPKFAGTRDVNPGTTNHIWFTAKITGDFPGQCKEFCGASHANMRLRVFSQQKADFDAWVKDQQRAPAPPAAGDAARGAEIFAKGQCVACHTIEGTPGKGTIGPNLTHVGSRTTIAAGILPNAPEALARWLHDPPGVKPGSLMPNLALSDADVTALVAYLQSLK